MDNYIFHEVSKQLESAVLLGITGGAPWAGHDVL